MDSRIARLTLETDRAGKPALRLLTAAGREYRLFPADTAAPIWYHIAPNPYPGQPSDRTCYGSLKDLLAAALDRENPPPPFPGTARPEEPGHSPERTPEDPIPHAAGAEA